MNEPCAKCGERPRASSHAYCRECRNVYQSVYRKRRYAAEQPYRDKIKRYQRMKRYGVASDEYDAMLAAQGGMCAICERAPNGRDLCIDHCHTTGRVRGLLCADCNGAIGMLQENPVVMHRAINYLTENK